MAWLGRRGSAATEVRPSAPGDNSETLSGVMGGATCTKLDEAGLEAAARDFSRRVRSAISALEDSVDQFENMLQGSVQHAQLGYQIFRHGMELGELSKQWFVTIQPDQQANPKHETSHHAERGRKALAESDWQSALTGLGWACMSQPRCRDLVSELGACAQQLAAWHLAQVGHLPNPEKFTQAVHERVARYQSLRGVIERDPKNPEARLRQNQVLSELVSACESWSAELGRFAPQERGLLSRQFGRVASSVTASLMPTTGSLQSYGDAVARSPGAVGAVEALKRAAKALMADTASDMPKLEEKLQAKLRLERYKAEMQQHYDAIDQWVGRSPQGDPMRPIIEANRLNRPRNARKATRDGQH